MRAAGSLRVVVIAPLRFALRTPHAGGLESAVWTEVDALRRRGHAVTLIAPSGSDFVERGSVFEIPPLEWPATAAPTDQTYPASYEAVSVPALDRALDAIEAHHETYDVISNHCLHPLPLRRAPRLGVPMVTTLHTPVDVAFVAAHRAAAGEGSAFLAVSAHTRREWAAGGVASSLLPNAIDPSVWRLGPGGEGLVWFGRIVPEKAPHLAIEVAERLGRPLTIAGRIGDERYARGVLFPRLGGSATYAGVLAPDDLARLVGCSALSLATPAWDEPFGLVAPEALMCGTPVVSFAVGGVPEIAQAGTGMRLAPAGDVEAMSDLGRELIDRAETDDTFRDSIRETALRRFSLRARTVRLEAVFDDAITSRVDRPELIA